jgi:hypothetical protein
LTVLNNNNFSSKVGDATTPLLASDEELQGSSRLSPEINVISDFVIQEKNQVCYVN